VPPGSLPLIVGRIGAATLVLVGRLIGGEPKDISTLHPAPSIVCEELDTLTSRRFMSTMVLYVAMCACHGRRWLVLAEPWFRMLNLVIGWRIANAAMTTKRLLLPTRWSWLLSSAFMRSPMSSSPLPPAPPAEIVEAADQ
jgi:hypothetical protein